MIVLLLFAIANTLTSLNNNFVKAWDNFETLASRKLNIDAGKTSPSDKQLVIAARNVVAHWRVYDDPGNFHELIDKLESAVTEIEEVTRKRSLSKSSLNSDFEKAFNFVISKEGNLFIVDTNLPGTPLVGMGKTEDEAKYNLCVKWLYMIAYYNGDNGGDSNYVPLILKTLSGQTIKK
jgi:hypothetical protein